MDGRALKRFLRSDASWKLKAASLAVIAKRASFEFLAIVKVNRAYRAGEEKIGLVEVMSFTPASFSDQLHGVASLAIECDFTETLDGFIAGRIVV